VKRRRARNLGDLETRRSGGIKVDWDLIHQAVSAIIDSFPKCGDPSARPPLRRPKAVGTTLPIDMKDGTRRSVQVVVDPKSGMGSIASGYNSTWKSQFSGQRVDKITIEPNAELCAQKAVWSPELTKVLAHELTHAADPGVGKQKRLYDFQKFRSGDPSPAEVCKYYNDPGEVKAHINEARSEMRSWQFRESRNMLEERARERGIRLTPADTLKLTSTYRRVWKCLTKKNKRLFMKMAARELG
jgi:hypothetical protein